MSRTHNILVISDLHLGEDLTMVAHPEISRDLRVGEAQLIAFLRKYTRRRADGKPWRLVINGDMVDFLGIHVHPDDMPTSAPGYHDHDHDHTNANTHDHAHATDDEREYGIGRVRAAACLRVRAVLEHHPGFFHALAGFVAAGHALEIIGGNHDTEFHWPEVQDALRQGIIDVWLATTASHRSGAASGATVGERIRFHEWFYHEPGVVWIEHGHQYDECCSYEYNLFPTDTADDTIVTNVDTAAMRYLVNPFAEASPHGSEEWSALGLLRFAFSQGTRITWQMVRSYHRFAMSLLVQWRAAKGLRARRARRAAHRDALRALGEQGPLAETTLRDLDKLQRSPLITNLRRLLQVLMLDKIVVWTAALVLMILAFIALPLWAWTLALVGCTVAAYALAERLDRGRTVNASRALSAVTPRLARHMDTRYIIFGHTHLPLARPVPRSWRAAHTTIDPNRSDRGDRGDTCWYFNTGTWVPSGKQGLLGSFTHVVIRSTPDGHIDGRLCQWRDGASRAFMPGRESQPGLRPRGGYPENMPDALVLDVSADRRR